MTAPITLDLFAPLLHQHFELETEGLAVRLELIEAAPLKHALPSKLGRQPFFLLFRGPTQLLLPQQTFSVNHGAIGAHQIFIVPVGPDSIGPRYEAIFN
ncbi:MAG: DUF6916 family protein [Burkholderiales bacterium]